VSVTFRDAGHILGSAMLELAIRENGETRTVIFSGDIGQWNKPIIRDPSVFDRADYVVMESTYGDRDHENRGTVRDQLCDVINATVDAGGNVIIPTFAIERAQELMYEMAQLLQEDRIPHVLVFLDSPMAVDATAVFLKHQECMDEETLQLINSGQRLFQFPGLQLVRHVHQSKAINRIRGSCVIMAGSGMCTAGRIKHHLEKNVSRPESTIVIAGYQANGTLGRELANGAPVVRIHGKELDVRARVTQIHGLSGHAGQSGLLKWLGHFGTPPRRLFLTHGEEDSVTELCHQITSKLGWAAEIPSYQAEYELD
jgi:metallo-beta-lactamase family protein